VRNSKKDPDTTDLIIASSTSYHIAARCFCTLTHQIPTDPQAADTNTLSPFLGLHISKSPTYAVSPLNPVEPKREIIYIYTSYMPARCRGHCCVYNII